MGERKWEVGRVSGWSPQARGVMSTHARATVRPGLTARPSRLPVEPASLWKCRPQLEVLALRAAPIQLTCPRRVQAPALPC